MLTVRVNSVECQSFTVGSLLLAIMTQFVCIMEFGKCYKIRTVNLGSVGLRYMKSLKSGLWLSFWIPRAWPVVDTQHILGE